MSSRVGARCKEVPNGGQSIPVTPPRAADGCDTLPVERAGGSRSVDIDVRPSGQFQEMGTVLLVGRLYLDVGMLQFPTCSQLTDEISPSAHIMGIKKNKTHTNTQTDE